MLAVFEGGDNEVLICQVDSAGTPITGDYFTGKNGDERDQEDYDLNLVEAPVLITNRELRVEPERTLTR